MPGACGRNASRGSRRRARPCRDPRSRPRLPPPLPDPFLGKQARNGVDEAPVLAAAQVLDHLHADQLVERAGDLLVRHQLDLDPVGEAGRGDVGFRALVVSPAESAALAGDAVVLGGVDQQTAVATTEVDKALARLQAQLLADALEFVTLELADRAAR